MQSQCSFTVILERPSCKLQLDWFAEAYTCEAKMLFLTKKNNSGQTSVSGEAGEDVVLVLPRM